MDASEKQLLNKEHLNDEMLSVKNLEWVRPEDIAKILENFKPQEKEAKVFSKYMRDKFKEKKLSQKEVFKRAGLSGTYGYKLISEEKKTAQRDVILKLCIGLEMTLPETQKALILSGFSVLDLNDRRDLIIYILINNKKYDLFEINSILEKFKEIPIS